MQLLSHGGGSALITLSVSEGTRKEGVCQEDLSSKSELDQQLGLEDFWLPKAGVFLLCYSAFLLLWKHTFQVRSPQDSFEHWNNIRLSCFTLLCQAWHHEFSRGLMLKSAPIHFPSKCYSHFPMPLSIISKSFLIGLAYRPHFSSNWNISLNAHLGAHSPANLRISVYILKQEI